MKQPHITSNNRTNWSSEKKTSSQPKGINYQQLLDKLDNKKEDKRFNIESSVNRKDLRKISFHDRNFSDEIEENDIVNKLDQKSIIPIPGVQFDDLENNGNYSGKSGNWNDTTNNQLSDGPQWNSMTF